MAVAIYTLVQKHQGRRPGEHMGPSTVQWQDLEEVSNGREAELLLPGLLSATLGHRGGLFHGRSLIFLFGPWASVLWKEQYWVLYIHRISFTDFSQLYQEVGIIFPPQYMRKWNEKEVKSFASKWNIQDLRLHSMKSTATGVNLSLKPATDMCGIPEGPVIKTESTGMGKGPLFLPEMSAI